MMDFAYIRLKTLLERDERLVTSIFSPFLKSLQRTISEFNEMAESFPNV